MYEYIYKESERERYEQTEIDEDRDLNNLRYISTVVHLISMKE